MITFINFYLIPGVVLGCIYALGAIGVSLTFGILRFANFAHGDIMTFGVYITLTLVLLTGAHPLLVAPVAMALTALLAVAIDRLFYRPFRSSPAIMLMIASLGMMLMIRSVVRFIWGVQLQSLVRGIEQPLAWLEPLRLLPKHLLIITGAVVLMVAVHLLLTRTKIGKAMRATSDNAELARVCGIDTETVIRMTWILGSVLAVAAGVFLAIDTHVETMMGFRLLVPMFAAAILGGIGKPYGAVAGGLVIGIVEELSAYPWIGTEPLLSPSYKAGVAFTIMVAMLIWRPQGLLHGRRF
ncbi:MAG: branched-chain amino acid ABC transporter permease [Aphanocapsa feldmannii 277cV]|uniref:Branched-chain amino acid ABC transporter permease n=2 Tax=Aphanocapsa feldmannii TaxID=192050 RepID=A0A524RKH2_9CHRO|nr:MAG: branched-chain amino acid ABC transporter permease [Aphanocapsa feldmannii 288cV]TGG90124.1 MAG: branched-chain amino acid ABC transporter permease [Aphanocapsa feldmannii 277cV]